MSDDIVKNLKYLSGEYEKCLSEIQAKIHILDAIPKARALVGKCFKSKNGFALFKRNTSWLYERVTGAVEDRVLVDTFLYEKSDKFVMTFDGVEYVEHFAHSTLTEISQKEYNKHFNELLRRVENKRFHDK